MIEKRYIPVVTPAECRKVYLEEILYIEYTYRKIIIHTLRNNYAFYDKIDEIKPYLDERFVYCLKHLIVNFDLVVCMKSGTINLVGGENLILGQQNFIKAKQQYAYYIRTRQDSLKSGIRRDNLKVSEKIVRFNGSLEEF